MMSMRYGEGKGGKNGWKRGKEEAAEAEEEEAVKGGVVSE